jgi:hypothetical protein
MARRIRPIISDLLAYGADLITIRARIRRVHAEARAGNFHAARARVILLRLRDALWERSLAQ